MGGLAELGINLPTLIAQLVNFAILFGLLYLVAYKPIMRMMDERSGKIKQGMEQAESIKQQAERAGEEAQARIEAAARQGQELVSRALKEGEELRHKSEEQAREEAETLVTRAQVEIQRERDGAISELRKEFADLAIKAAEKVIERSLDKKAHTELIEKVLEEAKTLKKG
ncbi:MAG: F0F1 ATP synthase subunit B [Chloroflexota bacterium]